METDTLIPIRKEDWNNLSPEEKKERQRIGRNREAKSHRDYLATLSPERREEIKANAKWRREERQREREQKAKEKQQKVWNKRELDILEYMKKSGTFYYHHSEADNMHREILKAIEQVNVENTHLEYNNYVWNHYGEGNNYMSISLFGKLWRHNEFATIYDVPLDGSWIFYGYDSGLRGSGHFHYMSAHPEDKPPYVPKVNPGGMPPITV